MHMKDRPKIMGSPKVGVGEIDTRAPFHSVKDAVSLFGDTAFSGEKCAIKKVKPFSAEKVLVKETQLHLAQKELNKLQEQLKNAENTKVEALAELEKARQTMEELTKRLKTTSEMKDAAIKATEAAKIQAKQLEESNSSNIAVTNGPQKFDLERTKAQYTSVLSKLNAAKQEVAKTHQDCNALLEAEANATKLAVEAEFAVKAHTERADEISRDISGAKETIEKVRKTLIKTQHEQVEIFSEKDRQRISYQASLYEYAKKLQVIKKEFDPELSKNLDVQLAETMGEIETLQNEINNAKVSDVDSMRSIASDLDGAKGSLQKVLEEESALQSLLESLKCELENLRKVHAELKEKEAETESMAGNLHVKLRKSKSGKSELDACLAEEDKARGVSNEMISTLNQVSSEAENARLEAEDMKIKAGQLYMEAETTKLSLEAAEKQLKLALEEAVEAKAAEARALDRIKTLSERTDAARSSTNAVITISREEFESLSHKAQVSDKLAEMKVAAAMAQVEAIKVSENEALQRLEAAQKEMSDIKAATEEALRRAEMADAAKKAVDCELGRWHEREQKKAAEAAAQILGETRSLPQSPVHYKVQKPNPSQKVEKMEKQRTSTFPKKVLLRNLSGIFHMKKSTMEVGSSSFIPGEDGI